MNYYSEAIKLNGKIATYFSNRAAAYLELGWYIQFLDLLILYVLHIVFVTKLTPAIDVFYTAFNKLKMTALMLFHLIRRSDTLPGI